MKQLLENYLKKIAETTIRGDAREENYYPYLKELLESLSEKKFSVTVLPKKTEAGNPDFRIWDGKQRVVGYIEAKAPEVFENLERAFGRKPSPEDILYYIYAVFYSDIYREKYAAFLKIDFPRVPLTRNLDLFKKMARLGKHLVDLHLLKSKDLDKTVAKYRGTGENDIIEKPIYQERGRRVYINKEKYFEGIAPDVWNYHIGGYQVLQKYLKDRKGRRLEDPRHYVQIATAISGTISLQRKIDMLYPDVEKELIKIDL